MHLLRLLMLLALTTGLAAANGVATVPPPAGPTPGTVDIAWFERALEQAPDSIQVVDVRTPYEFQQGALPGAINIPLRRLEAALPSLAADRAIIFVCDSGHRAERAYQLVRRLRPALPTYYLHAYISCTKDGLYQIEPIQ
jgi:rhodanese-related sulfurtransferase